MTKDASEQVARAFANLEHGDEFTASDLRAILDDHARLTAALEQAQHHARCVERENDQIDAERRRLTAERDALRAALSRIQETLQHAEGATPLDRELIAALADNITSDEKTAV